MAGRHHRHRAGAAGGGARRGTGDRGRNHRPLHLAVRPCGPLGRLWRRTIRPLLAPIGILVLAVLAMSAPNIGLTGRAVDEPAGVSPTVLPASGTDPMRSRPQWSADAAVLRDANDGAGPAGSCRPDPAAAGARSDGGSCPSAGGSAGPGASTGEPAATTQDVPDRDDPPPTNRQAFDAGNIISDAVFNDRASMTDAQIESFIDDQGAGCLGPKCLKDLRIDTPDQPADRYCSRYQGDSAESAAVVIGKLSRACGVNPQVMLVTLQKESGLLTRSDATAATYEAAWGWHCPDTGPDGTANCDPRFAGYFNQAYGMAKQWSRYRLDPDRYRYRAGQSADILWNVVESGCGSAPVTIRNTATAALYNYTPYQPNTASLAAYPGPGDRCSSYGNRNFFFLFTRYFGSTGGGPAAAVPAAGVAVTVPANRFVDPVIAGRTITAPSPAVAAGLEAGLSTLGLPYVWGGGGSGAGPNNGCVRGGGMFNSCGTEIGFDCSGLTAFVLGRAGFAIPGNSALQRRGGDRIGWDRALPGDVVGFPGHVAIYLGTVDGARFILEASFVGTPVHVTRLTRGDADPMVYRYWAATSSTQVSVAAPAGGRNAWSAPVPAGSGFVPSTERALVAESAPPGAPVDSPRAVVPEAPGPSAPPTDPSSPTAVPTAGVAPGTTTPSVATSTATPVGTTARAPGTVARATPTAASTATSSGAPTATSTGTPAGSAQAGPASPTSTGVPTPTGGPTPMSSTPAGPRPSGASCSAVAQTPTPTPTPTPKPGSTQPSAETEVSPTTTDRPASNGATEPASQPPSNSADSGPAGGAEGGGCPAG